jgi:hypothetical protein
MHSLPSGALCLCLVYACLTTDASPLFPNSRHTPSNDGARRETKRACSTRARYAPAERHREMRMGPTSGMLEGRRSAVRLGSLWCREPAEASDLFCLLRHGGCWLSPAAGGLAMSKTRPPAPTVAFIDQSCAQYRSVCSTVRHARAVHRAAPGITRRNAPYDVCRGWARRCTLIRRRGTTSGQRRMVGQRLADEAA